MGTQSQHRAAAGVSLASARPFIGASVHYYSTGGDALRRGQAYAATITAINLAEDSVSLHVVAPTAKFDILSARFSPAPEPGAWTWPAAGA
jgi:hypothetical protein